MTDFYQMYVGFAQDCIDHHIKEESLDDISRSAVDFKFMVEIEGSDFPHQQKVVVYYLILVKDIFKSFWVGKQMQHGLDESCIDPYIPDDALILHALPEYLTEIGEKAPKKAKKAKRSKGTKQTPPTPRYSSPIDEAAAEAAVERRVLPSFADSFFADDSDDSPSPANNPPQKEEASSSDCDTISSGWNSDGPIPKDVERKRKRTSTSAITTTAAAATPSPRHVTWRQPPVESALSPENSSPEPGEVTPEAAGRFVRKPTPTPTRSAARDSAYSDHGDTDDDDETYGEPASKRAKGASVASTSKSRAKASVATKAPRQNLKKPHHGKMKKAPVAPPNMKPNAEARKKAAPKAPSAAAAKWKGKKAISKQQQYDAAGAAPRYKSGKPVMGLVALLSDNEDYDDYLAASMTVSRACSRAQKSLMAVLKLPSTALARFADKRIITNDGANDQTVTSTASNDDVDSIFGDSPDKVATDPESDGDVPLIQLHAELMQQRRENAAKYRGFSGGAFDDE